jgi:hypothetical protein
MRSETTFGGAPRRTLKLKAGTVSPAPIKTNAKLAFHDNMPKAGVCIDCDVKADAAGKEAPTKCADCHKKENA